MIIDLYVHFFIFLLASNLSSPQWIFGCLWWIFLSKCQ